MKDEIKEILEEINKIIDNTSYNEELTYFYFQTSHISKLLDYITNLQEENERLKENNYNMQGEMAKTWAENERLKELEQEHQRINGELREENKRLRETGEK